jgi:hypothetical protein
MFAAVAPLDTVAPDSFAFSQLNYTVPPGATNVEISVLFQPGNRSFSGTVGYYTEDDTARHGIDYLESTGHIHFSGVAEKTFHIPIAASSAYSYSKTFRVFLSHPTAYLWNSPATVVIEFAPRLLCSTRDGKLVLSWPGDWLDYVLESSPHPDCSEAMQVSSAPVLVNGRWQVEEPASADVKFYRLRKN